MKITKAVWISLLVLAIAAVALLYAREVSAPRSVPAPDQGRPIAQANERCGGNMRNAPVCATGFHCAPAPGSHLPFGDVGGVCVAD